MPLISFGIYTVVTLLIGVAIGASLTYRKQHDKTNPLCHPLASSEHGHYHHTAGMGALYY